MKNPKTKTLDVAALAAPTVGSRDVADAVKSEIARMKASVVELDFRNVEFISRSAAHAFLVMKEDFERRLLSKKKILFINTSASVSEMLRVVAANRAVPRQKSVAFVAKETDIDSLVEDPDFMKV